MVGDSVILELFGLLVGVTALFTVVALIGCLVHMCRRKDNHDST